MSRYLVALTAAVAVGLLALSLPGHADDKRAADTKPVADHKHDSHFMDCAKACHACARECDACGAHCAKLVSEGKKEHLKTLKTCQDCATFCSAAAGITARSGPFSDLICKSCADACKRCGDACSKHKTDEMMKRCADECYRCEKACKEMLKHVGH
jgi:Domain of Unknown Function (DUF326)